jgi:hypothetical protein
MQEEGQTAAQYQQVIPSITVTPGIINTEFQNPVSLHGLSWYMQQSEKIACVGTGKQDI